MASKEWEEYQQLKSQAPPSGKDMYAEYQSLRGQNGSPSDIGETKKSAINQNIAENFHPLPSHQPIKPPTLVTTRGTGVPTGRKIQGWQAADKAVSQYLTDPQATVLNTDFGFLRPAEQAVKTGLGMTAQIAQEGVKNPVATLADLIGFPIQAGGNIATALGAPTQTIPLGEYVRSAQSGFAQPPQPTPVVTPQEQRQTYFNDPSLAIMDLLGLLGAGKGVAKRTAMPQIDFQPEAIRGMEQRFAKTESVAPEYAPGQRHIEPLENAKIQAFAKRNNLKFDGAVDAPKGGKIYSFTDPQNGGTFATKSLPELEGRIRAKRAEFEAGKIAKRPPEEPPLAETPVPKPEPPPVISPAKAEPVPELRTDVLKSETPKELPNTESTINYLRRSSVVGYTDTPTTGWAVHGREGKLWIGKPGGGFKQIEPNQVFFKNPSLAKRYKQTIPPSEVAPPVAKPVEGKKTRTVPGGSNPFNPQQKFPDYEIPLNLTKETATEHPSYKLWADYHSKPVAQSLAIIDSREPIRMIEGTSKRGGLYPFSVYLENGKIFSKPATIHEYANKLLGENIQYRHAGVAAKYGKGAQKGMPEVGKSAAQIAQRYETLGIKPYGVAIKNARRLLDVIEKNEYDHIVHPDNKISRRLFEEITGKKLPKGANATRDFFAQKPSQPGMPSKVQIGGSMPGLSSLRRIRRGEKEAVEGGKLKETPETFNKAEEVKIPLFKKQGIGKGTEEFVTLEQKTKVPVAPEGQPLGNLGLKDVEIERIRKESGLGELPTPQREKWERNMREARQNRLDESALETADRIISTKEPPNRGEYAGMVLKASKLSDEYEAAIKTASGLAEKGDRAAVAVEWKRAQAIRDQIDKITEASDLAGTEAARDLSIRRMMINREDLSLAKVVQTVQAFKGRKLTLEETQHYAKLTEDLKVKTAQLTELEKKHAELLAQQEKKQAERIAVTEAKKVKIVERTAAAKAKILAERADIKKQLQGLGLRVNDVTGVTAEASYLIGKLAVNYIKEGAVSLDAVVQKVLVDLPELTASDVYRAILSRDPKAQKKAFTETTRKISEIKQQAKLLLDIENAEKGIFEPSKPRQMQSAEILALRRRLTQLRNLAYKTTDTQAKLEKAGRTINGLQEQLSNQFRNLRKNKPIDDAELASMKEKITELRKIMKTEDILADLNEQLRTREFKIKPRPEPKPIPPELERAQIEARVARRKIRAAIEDARPMTLGRATQEGINLGRTIQATADMSATLRQGLVLSVRHPVVASKAFGKAVKATFSEFSYEQIDNALRSSPTNYIREKSGLHLTDIGERLTAREEMFMSRLAEKIPVLGTVIRASERHMTTHLNLLRAGVFDDFLAKYPNATTQELKAISNWINVATGRGDWAHIAGPASKVLFAPRFAFSRIQTPYMIFKHWKNPRVRKEIAKDYAAVGTLGLSLLGLAKLSGAEVGTDPRSSDFGKIKIGNTRIDMWGGLQQPMRLTARIVLSATDRAGLTGKDLLLSEKEVDPLDIIGNFAAYKLAPHITIPAELIRGKTIVGEPIAPSETAVRAVLPLVYKDIYEAAKKDSPTMGAVAGGLSFFGGGVTTFEGKRKNPRPNEPERGKFLRKRIDYYKGLLKNRKLDEDEQRGFEERLADTEKVLKHLTDNK